MITAHLPSGYIVARAGGWTGPAMAAAFAGAVFPDLDLVWMALADDGTNYHHTYWVHAPVFAFLVSILLILATRRHPVVVAFAAGWIAHIVLDSPTGGMMWAWPFSDRLYYLVRVHTNESRWILTFLTHWTFVLELMIWSVAAMLWLGRDRRPA